MTSRGTGTEIWLERSEPARRQCKIKSTQSPSILTPNLVYVIAIDVSWLTREIPVRGRPSVSPRFLDQLFAHWVLVDVVNGVDSGLRMSDIAIVTSA